MKKNVKSGFPQQQSAAPGTRADGAMRVEASYAGARIPTVEPVPQWDCPHGNHFCVACDDCRRLGLGNN